MQTHCRVTRVVLAALAVWAATALAGAAAGSAPAAEVRSPWQLFGRAKTADGGAVIVPTWSANRVWVLVVHAADGGTLASARVAGSRLTSFAAQRLAAGDVRGIIATSRDWFVDGRLVVRTRDGPVNDALATASLIPNGQLGEPQVLSDDLLARAKEVVPQVETVGIHTGVRVRNRIIWTVVGAPEPRGISDFRNYLLACCSESGAAVDLTRLKGGLQTQLLFPRSGWDTRGRLWLAWLDTRRYAGAVRGVPRILRLDPATLAPRSQAVAAPRVVADKFELVCASTCRIVAQTARGDIVSWAPGERSSTLVARGWRPRKVVGSIPDARLLAASVRSGHLVVAFHGVRGKTEFADSTMQDEIRVVRGDARGARAREIGSAIRVANEWPPANRGSPPAGPLVYGTLTPRGLVVVEQFQLARRPGGSAPLLGAVVPLGP